MRRFLSGLSAVAFLSAILALGLLLTPAPAEACMGSICCIGCSFCGAGTLCCDACGPCLSDFQTVQYGMGHRTRVEFLPENRAKLTIEGFVTTHLEAGFECITGLGPVPGVESINSIVNYNTLTNEPFWEVTFDQNENASLGLAQIAATEGIEVVENGDWQGFVSNITGSVEDGVVNHFVLEVTLGEGVTQREFLRALREHGTYFTASSEGGLPNGGHEFVRHLGANEIIVESSVVPPEGLERSLVPQP